MRQITNLRHSIVFATLLVMSVVAIHAQFNTNQAYVQSKLTNYINFTAPEKAYLQTDKDVYTNGETIWFKAYLVNGITHIVSTKSRVVYVELTDAKGTMVAQQELLIEDENASGDILIPSEINEGKHHIRVYTKYMLNEKEPVIFQKEIDIWQQQINDEKGTDKKLKKEKKEVSIKLPEPIDTISQNLSVQFFPEGGDLVTGLVNIVGIKVTENTGKGISLTGKIIDQNDNFIALFKSYEFGLGRFYLKIDPNITYYAEIEIDGQVERYPLPTPLPKGYTLQVTNNGEDIRIRVATNIENGLKESILVGHLRGDMFLKHSPKNVNNNSYSLKLLTTKLEDGIAHISLFTKEGEPVCERLVFIENPKNNIQLSLDTDKPSYSFRDKVTLSLDMADDKGKPISGDFSVSVATASAIKNLPVTIKSWFLLDSDLGGTVENPDYFFKESTEGRAYKLDLLMLTHGWRRFTWKSFRTKGVSKALTYKPEKGIMITGTTTKFKNKYAPKKTITTLNLLGDNLFQTKDTTNVQGKFNFGPFFFKDSIQGVLSAAYPDKNGGKIKDFSIQLDNPFPKIDTNTLTVKEDKGTTIYEKQYLKEALRKKLTDFKYDPKVTQLKEVTVTSERITNAEIIKEKLDKRTLYGGVSPFNRIIPDSINWAVNNSIFELLRLVAGVQIFGAFPDQQVRIRGGTNTVYGDTSPLYLLDGIPVDIGFIQSIPVFDVLFIDVLKGNEAAIYGVRGGNGVIAVYTKTGEDFSPRDRETPGITSKMIPGFYKVREFYAPNYSISNPKQEKPDYRTTLLWHPSLKLETEKDSKLSFYTGDSSGNYLIKVEGISNDGKPISTTKSFNVKENTEL